MKYVVNRTICVWILLALVLVTSGVRLYPVGTQESAPSQPNAESISVAPSNGEPATVVNSSAFPRKQRGVFLLAVGPGNFGDFYTRVSDLKAALEGHPDDIRYNGTAYETHNEAGAPSMSTVPSKRGRDRVCRHRCHPHFHP